MRKELAKDVLMLYRKGHKHKDISKSLNIGLGSVSRCLAQYGTGEQISMRCCPFCKIYIFRITNKCVIALIGVRENQKKPTERAARRARTANGIVDRDITIQRLYERDRGICWLCGGGCNWNDKIVKNGVVVAGESYPSIDHVVPLSKGGSQSWGNVRLVHRHCNSVKGIYDTRRVESEYPGIMRGSRNVQKGV